MTEVSQFWDKIARKYAARPIGDIPAYEQSMARVRSHLGSEDRVLELGCGTGSTALLLAPDVGRITGSDISSEMIAIAREKPAPENIDFEVADADHAGQGAPYDAVLAFNLLHLVPDLPETLAHARACLRDGGLFISKTPCLGGKAWLYGPLIAIMRLFGKAPPVSLFGVDALETQVRVAGFEIIETGDFPKKPPCRLIVARKI